MPELPDVIVYCDALTTHTVGRRLTHVRVMSPFVLRSFDPPIDVLDGQVLRMVSRVGKRLVLGFDEGLRLVVHLMIAGRLRWRKPGQKLGMGPRMVLATFEFEHGTLYFTEAGSTKRASLHLVRGDEAVHAMDRGGIEPLSATIDAYAEALRRENHTLKRSLTDPRLFSGIGNAYSDEILNAARLSPMKLSQSLTDAQVVVLRDATQRTLTAWTARLRAETGEGFPEKVTAFHDEMAVHGRFGKPCPTCGAPVQRIVYAENECNYCAVCQTEGRLLADRALSRLLRDDWPKRLEEW